MSRMRTSRASFSWARPAMRRACSSGVRVSSGPSGFRPSVAAVKAEPGDLCGDAGRHQRVDGLPPGNSFPDLAGRHVRRVELEREDAVAVALEVGRSIARARADGEPDPAQDLEGL